MDSRKQLSEFLKSCRARVTPGELGLPVASRRRTPGLRREDVAAHAGVSVTWYTWLEQGRDIRVSTDVLERVSSTLRLSSDEREYLFALVQHRPAPLTRSHAEQVSPALERMIHSIAVPAIAMTARWDVVAWNALYAAALRDPGEVPAERRNLLRMLLIDDNVYRGQPEMFEAMARRVVAKFRVDYSQFADDPDFQELITELREASPAFGKLWGSAEVAGRSEAVVNHPQHGGIQLEHSSYVPEGSPNLRVVVYVPCDAESAAKIRKLAS